MQLREAYEKKELEKERRELEEQINKNKELITNMERDKDR